MEFNDILRTLRKNKNLKQKDIAEQLAIDQSVVSDWENGEKYPQYDNLIKLSEFFSLSLDELMGKKINKDISRFFNLGKIREQGKLSLEDLRKEFNMPSENLASFLGVSKGTLSNWEKNGLPNIEIYKKIFEIFELNLELIMDLK